MISSDEFDDQMEGINNVISYYNKTLSTLLNLFIYVIHSFSTINFEHDLEHYPLNKTISTATLNILYCKAIKYTDLFLLKTMNDSF